jgi:hypothetical protein
VSGNKIVDSTNTTVRLLGVNRAGTEYSCINGNGNFDGDIGDTAIAAIKAWKTNVVRVPLNEDCWLGLNKVSAAAAAAYTSVISDFVTRLEAQGLYVILDLHWNGPGTDVANGQLPMADADHAPAFWTSVTTQFKDDLAVIFDLYNEPYINTNNAQTSDVWGCWLNGCTMNSGNAPSMKNQPVASWQSAGMQSLVDAVRNAGGKQILMLGGLTFSNTFDGWVSHLPKDPLNNLAVSFHVYNFTGCNTQSCWGSNISALAASYPVVTGELGENDCAHGFIDSYMTWADSAGVSYLGWAWNTADCKGFPALVTDYMGTPTAYGAGLQAHLATVGP